MAAVTFLPAGTFAYPGAQALLLVRSVLFLVPGNVGTQSRASAPHRDGLPPTRLLAPGRPQPSQVLVERPHRVLER